MPVVESPFGAPDDRLLKYEPYYPDVVAAGSVLAAFQAGADRAGYGFAAGLMNVPGWRCVAAEVADGFRSTRILMGQGARSFIVDCWAGGVSMAAGQTRDLPEVAGVARSWLRALRVRDLVTHGTPGGRGAVQGAAGGVRRAGCSGTAGCSRVARTQGSAECDCQCRSSTVAGLRMLVPGF